MDHSETEQARELHRTLEFIGLRAQASTVGLLQLCAELVRAGVIDDQAIGRIKQAVFREIAVTHTAGYNRAEFERTLRQRLDTLFPGPADGHGGGAEAGRVGPIEDMQSSLAPEAEPPAG